jgi:hypothetical protein
MILLFNLYYIFISFGVEHFASDSMESVICDNILSPSVMLPPQIHNENLKTTQLTWT